MSFECILGDALQILPTLEAGSIDAIITDLPYGTTACAWDEVIPFVPMWEQVKRLLKPRGVFVTTASQPFTSALVMSNLEWFRYEWIWDKARASGHLDANHKPLKAHENICVFYQEQPNYNPQKRAGEPYAVNGKRASHAVYGEANRTAVNKEYDGRRYPRSVLPFSQGANSEDRFHPTQKPVTLYQYLIRTYTNPSDTVLDFCCGSGTTGVAAIKEGRNFIGMELDSGYHAIAQKRLQDAAAQPMLLDITA